jgi:hypothetical protein
MKLNLPHDDLERLVELIETYGNNYIEELKRIVLWENLHKSGIVSRYLEELMYKINEYFFKFKSYLIAYVIYSIGCTFNTLTLITFCKFSYIIFTCKRNLLLLITF